MNYKHGHPNFLNETMTTGGMGVFKDEEESLVPPERRSRWGKTDPTKYGTFNTQSSTTTTQHSEWDDQEGDEYIPYDPMNIDLWDPSTWPENWEQLEEFMDILYGTHEENRVTRHLMGLLSSVNSISGMGGGAYNFSRKAAAWMWSEIFGVPPVVIPNVVPTDGGGPAWDG